VSLRRRCDTIGSIWNFKFTQRQTQSKWRTAILQRDIPLRSDALEALAMLAAGADRQHEHDAYSLDLLQRNIDP
jgi:hypothetical protein